MKSAAHRIYISVLIAVVVMALIVLVNYGWSYYNTHLSNRFFHPDYNQFKPSGNMGHGYGILGSVLMISGIVIYMLRKRLSSLSRLGLLKHWLEFHIFLCTLGPLLILFHTTFKFGGIVAISFWSMVAVFASGIIGRFIYIQIPRSIEGNELSLVEIKGLKDQISNNLSTLNINEENLQKIKASTRKKAEKYYKNIVIRLWKQYFNDRRALNEVKSILKSSGIKTQDRKSIIKLANSEISINRRIERLDTMKNLFKYWHVAHLPFALVMIIIMIIHIGVTIYFGYTWVF